MLNLFFSFFFFFNDTATTEIYTLSLHDALPIYDLVFALGPAGTGKTYISVAMAVKALKSKTVKKIIITRPAVEAGENLGFLPGDLKEKIYPYFLPISAPLNNIIPLQQQQYYIKRA